MRTIFSASPLHFDDSVEADTLKNVVSHSDATALANIVLPGELDSQSISQIVDSQIVNESAQQENINEIYQRT